ncbi:MAG: hypothetical protein QNJ63_29595, partial [Calothrix sp. MO_192.B10]|nr:hypothetical protein [Calothrix sp. MO_192.B10]
HTKLRSIIVVRVNEIATLREALRVRHLTAVALCRETRPPHCLLYAGKPVHRSGLPLTRLRSVAMTGYYL